MTKKEALLQGLKPLSAESAARSGGQDRSPGSTAGIVRKLEKGQNAEKAKAQGRLKD
jgi:hypothetical protein